MRESRKPVQPAATSQLVFAEVLEKSKKL